MEGACISESDFSFSGWKVIGKLNPPTSNQSENPNDVDACESPVPELKEMQPL